MEGYEAAKKRLREAIIKEVFVPAQKEGDLLYYRSSGLPKKEGWIFDFRRILMRPLSLRDVAICFWQEHGKRYPFQLGSLETAGIPLSVGITDYLLYEQKKEDITSFFIRKSRKKDGLMRMVEGVLMPGRSVILVDDILNSGSSFIRQIEVLEGLGFRVSEVWAVLRFRDEEYYTYFKERGIAVRSLFELNDFSEELPVQNLPEKTYDPVQQPYTCLWKFRAPNPNYKYVVPKSDPVIDNERVYMGTDGGTFFALRQKDGSPAWSYKVGYHAKGKSIFSSPALYKDVVIFGAYDGNVYCLNKENGKKRWVFFDADWVGSSPAIAEDLGLAFIGLEFGIVKRRGGIAAIDIATGSRTWGYYDMPCFTHSTPLYIPSHRQVVIGSNDGAARLFNAKTGELLWTFKTGTPTEEEYVAGFSAYDIKESFAYDATNDQIIFGNVAGGIFAVDRKTGKERWRFKAGFGIYATPLIYNNTVLIPSVDRTLYCLNLKTGSPVWQRNLGARIFASPVLINGHVYIGANTGRLSEIDPQTGEELSLLTLSERITNKPAYNPDTQRFFVPTFANEIYCVERHHE